MATILVGTGPAMPLFLGGAVICGSGTMLLIRFVARSKDFADRDAT
jgi:hypothetical protein